VPCYAQLFDLDAVCLRYFKRLRRQQRYDAYGNAIAIFAHRLRNDTPLSRLRLLGDTNSSLCAIVTKRLGIPVFHMEAGNRCYDDRVPVN
jgi:UDP-N-acetylglucosamine 2-epimerase